MINENRHHQVMDALPGIGVAVGAGGGLAVGVAVAGVPGITIGLLVGSAAGLVVGALARLQASRRLP